VWVCCWRAALSRPQLLDTLLTLPMVMPPTVLGYYLLTLLGRRARWAAGCNSSSAST
jgi:molybdate transport system permease protein